MATIIVYHREYGCESGCCGHAIKVDDVELPDSFQFDHPWDDVMEKGRKWAEEFVLDQMGAEHVKDLDWENCFISDI